MRELKNLIFIAILLMSQFVWANSEITKAAEEGLQRFLKCVPENMMADYGFHNEEEVKSCTLGEAFKVYTIKPQSLKNYTEQDTISSLVEDTNMQYFTVSYAGKNCAVLVLAKIEEDWQAVSFGQVPLAKELQGLQESWTKERGFTPQLVVVYQAKKFFFHIPQLDSTNFTKITLHSQRNINYFRTQSLQAEIPSLWQEVKENLVVEKTQSKNQAVEDPSEIGILQVLNVPQVYQRYDQWCWAGCSQSVFNFYGKNINQEQIAQEGTKGLNIWNWLWGVTYNPYRKGIKELLEMGGLRTYSMTSSLTQSQLQAEITNQKPVVVRWGWDNGGGHFVVCKGISGNTTYIMDPWSGPTMNSYSWLVRGNGHTWTSTLKTSR